MWHRRPLIFWTRLIAVIVIAASRLLHADDSSASSGGYKIVPVRVGGKTIPVRVKESEGDPFKSVSTSNSTGKYDPENIFSRTSSMADKEFSSSSTPLSPGNTEFKSRDQDTFITKSYDEDTSAPTAPNLDTKARLPTAGAYSRDAAGFDRSYPAPNADLGQARTALPAASTASEQDHTAVLGGREKTEALASSSMADKQYLGPGAQNVPDGIVIKDNVVISRMSGLPNRELSIDEVRNLINHDTKPNTNAKPEEPSKPLNDPDYKPQPLRDAPAPPDDDNKDDPVPPPGTMAAPPAPENSEPLPQP